MSFELPHILIVGPFWKLSALVPGFGLPNVVPKKSAIQEDRIFPVRTLLADAAMPAGDTQNWRRPRLVSAHVFAGTGEHYHTDDEWLEVELPKGKLFRVNDDKFRTFEPAHPARAGFQHVILEPILDGAAKWPADFETPPFRLVAGTIDILGNARAFRFLGPPLSTGNDVLFRLTPDGIELEREAPFPGRGNIPGRFLLYVTSTGARLRLLTEGRPPKEIAAWRDAWFSVTAKDDTDSRGVVGVKIEGQRGPIPPAFVWRVEVKSQGVQPLVPSVEVPASDVEARLLSPRTAAGIDGEVTLTPESYTLSTLSAAAIPPQVAVQWEEADVPVVLVAELKPIPDAGGKLPTLTTRLRLDATPKELSVRLLASNDASTDVPHRCAHDEVKLASSLRRAYGLGDLLPGTLDPERPMLSAFVPLDDGWVQLPVPNLPQPDANKDGVVVPPTQSVSNVLSGYLRFAQTGNTPEVLSAFGAPFQVAEAPWVITVEGTKAAALVAGIRPGSTAAEPIGGELVAAVVALEDPELSTRGLLWFSADRPDAFEALPRIGAGAGAFFDLPLETYDVEAESAVQFTLAGLALKVVADTTQPQSKPQVLTRTMVAVDVAFDGYSPTGWSAASRIGRKALEDSRDVLTGTSDPAKEPAPPLPPVRWQRHPVMPCAAEMPMTRGASSSVRPLESRDLVPFVVAVEDPQTDKPARWLRLGWIDAAVFPEITKVGGTSLQLKPVRRWPWPEPSFKREHGIALAAFGVPGAELVFPKPFASPKADPWPLLEFALRSDIPALDEAFATATLPPQPDDQAVPEEREVPPPLPTPLAHDWVSMRRFWEEQDRRHQVARVAHSYLVPQTTVGAAKAVTNLVGDLKWVTSVDFIAGKTSDPLPYGQAVIGDSQPPLSGNTALLGVTETFTIKSGELKQDAKGVVKVVGYAPGSFRDGDGFLRDSRMSGVKAAMSAHGMLWRSINDPRIGVVGLATLLQSITVEGLFDFWFKDLPVGSNGKFIPIAQNGDTGFIDFDAWQDGNFARSGFEWRLSSQKHPELQFPSGRDRIPFFGFWLEPLRLTSCELAMTNGEPTAVKSAEIAAHLTLGPMPDVRVQDGNVVALKLIADGAGCLKVDELVAAGLSFRLHPHTGFKQPVRVTMGVKWRRAIGGKPAGLEFQNPTLLVTMFGDECAFASPVVTADSEKVTVEWSAADESEPKLVPKEGKLVVHRATLTVAKADPAKPDLTDKVALMVDHGIYLTPKAAASSGEAGDAAIQVRLTDDTVVGVKLLGATVPPAVVAWRQLVGAFTLRTLEAVEVKPPLFPGFPVTGTVSLGFAARVGALTNGRADLTAGYFDAEIVATNAPTGALKVRRVVLHGERVRRSEEPDSPQWDGTILLYGGVELKNAIRWPEIADGALIEEIPFPEEGGVKSGRKLVVLKGGYYTHTVTYALEGHEMAFDLPARLALDATVWTLPVVSRHTILDSRSAVVGSFSGVETIAIGTAKALVPPPNLDADPLTFAPRRATTVVNGADTGKTETGMIAHGIGRIGTVLSGALGLRFRRAFWPSTTTERPGLFLAGGFVGMLATGGEDASLLRLPVFAPLDEQVLAIQQQGHGPTVEVMWTDSRAIQNLVAIGRGAVTPASESEAAIRSALLAGSRTAARKGISPSATVTAVLVEQSFAVPTTDKEDLEKTPFFIASAVSLARCLRRLSAEPKPAVVSLLAGYAIAGKNDTRSLASAIVTRDLGGGNLRTNRRPPQEVAELATIGEHLVVHAWTGPNVADLDAIVPVSLIAGPAFADHARPRAVLLRTDQNGQWRYDAAELPRPFERPPIAVPIGEKRRAFADAGRGYGMPPGADPLRWLAAPDEVDVQPFRDADLAGDTSGLAGLSRIAAMPAHATDVSGGGPGPDDPALNGLVWVAQTRAPVYLPLGVSSMKAPPIPWLSPGTPRPRHPTNASLDAVLRKLDVTIQDDKFQVQPVLPAAATVATVGDRSGISLARITRFESAFDGLGPFDARTKRFGRPAQGGAWSARTERTPRPGILPKNRGENEERDRRPCASPFLIEPSVTVLAAPADGVRGEANAGVGAWTVTFLAAKEWNGMITASWDGTVRVHAEIDVHGPVPGDVVETLLRLVFPFADKSATQLCVSAAVVIGSVAVPFVRMHFESSVAFQPVHAGVVRGLVTLVLDARRDDESRSPGAALGAIASALDGGVLPPAELQLVVHPESRPKPTNFTPPKVLDLTPTASALPNGEARAPVTLRMPLAPVIRTTGALPLAPTSLLFVDLSYDAGLSSEPAQDRALIAPTTGSDLPAARGSLTVTLYADRSRVNRKASITFMIDLAFEKKLDAFAQELLGNDVDGDILEQGGAFALNVRVVPKTGLQRQLFVAEPKTAPPVALARVYELPLSALVEEDGTPAALAAGDIVEIRVFEEKVGAVTATVVGTSTSPAAGIEVSQLDTAPVGRTRSVLLTDEPIAEPPSALYAALTRRERAPGNAALALPLVAQSPLPWRVDLRDAKRDFRRGLMRRSAVFIWNLACPSAKRGEIGVFIVKVDRNGQTFLPDAKALFEKAR